VTSSFYPPKAKSSSQKEMVIKLGYETVKTIDDGGLKLSFLGQPPNLLIPPVLSLEVTQPITF
jgi:hypothetical protein